MSTLAAAAGLPAVRRRPALGAAGWAGVLVLAALVVMALFAPSLSPHDPEETVGDPFQPPSRAHWLGTNDIGQDIASELIHGARISLTIGFLAAAIAVGIGTAVGVVAGYFGGWTEATLMRAVDLVLVVPFLPLMILLAAYLGPSFWNIIIVIGALVWARPARVIRAQVLAVKALDYVEAACAIGCRHGRVIVRHILPSVLPLALAQFILAASNAILIEASLSFLGLGDPTAKSWGTVLYYAQARNAFLSGAWVWWVIPPGVLITAATLGFAFTGFALEEVLNPRMRGRRGAG
ncbi:MAG: ABC transporter permease [Armatimonadota bacterium]|nr:ABC transporter permease [Armatimonadota bacterium]MDR7421287.1 ABC transporter permease [Armatimonadota bacterium]MDR7454080.1 ABC transporter permease [Armatimonadota bacterium]MDR7455790.1 ABC transporter permease [Armatimonadota bacterium]MDR7496426.1 ABC transporter permease [Armatimonadota bacterium]